MKQIYVAEDSPTQALRVRRILSALPDCELTFFADGLEVYRGCLKKPPDVLLLDLILPSLHGLAVCRLLKFHEDHRHLPVLIFSSITEADLSEKATAVGASVLLRKPFSPEDLIREVTGLLTAGG